MKNYKIAPDVYKVALRVVTWNHAIWNQYGYADAPDAFAKSIIEDAAKIGLPVRYSMCDGLSPDFRAPGNGSIKLSNALDIITHNRKAHVTPLMDRRRHKDWLDNMHWYNVRRYYNEYVNETWAEVCAYYISALRNTGNSVRRLRELASGYANAVDERKHELDARMNAPKDATHPLCWPRELPF